jgi:tRNA threonylcarbamoyladenosine biosynthesis protein TsaB
VNILAFDTSNDTCTVALQYQQKIMTAQNIAAKQQAKVILPLIQKVLQEAKLGLPDIDAIAFASGPGSFTGIRIAASVAQGLAFAAKKPVLALSTLAVLAQSAFLDHGCESVLVMLDARMQEIYAALYCLSPNQIMKLQGEEKVISPHQWQHWPSAPWVGIGSAWQIYETTLLQQTTVAPQAIYTNQLPNPNALLKLAHETYVKGQMIAASEALPTYLR